MSQDHSIGKYTVQVEASSSAQYQAIHQVFEAQKKQLFECIEKVFNLYFSEDKFIEISKIHLDVGVLPAEDFIPILQSRLKLLLEQQFDKILKNNQVQNLYKPQEAIPSQTNLVILEQYLWQGYSVQMQQYTDFNWHTYLGKLLTTNREGLYALVQKAVLERGPLARLYKLQLLVQNFDALQPFVAFVSTQLGLRIPQVDVMQDISPAGFDEHPYLQSLLEGNLTLTAYDFSELLYQLSPEEQAYWAHLFFKNLDKEPFRQGLIRYFASVSMLKDFLSTVTVLGNILKDWEALEQFYVRLGYALPVHHIAYKVFFIDYISTIKKDVETRNRLVYKYLIANIHYLKDSSPLTSIKQLFTHVTTRQEASGVVSDFIQYVRLQELSMDKTAPIGVLSEVLYFLQYGIFTNSQAQSLVQLIQQLLADQSSLLYTRLMELWSEEGLRYRLAYRLEIQQLQVLVFRLWGHDPSFSTWLALKSRLDHMPDVQPQTLRDFYKSYFEFLALASTDTMPKSLFEWIAATAKHTLLATQSYTEGLELDLLLVKLLPETYGLVQWQALFARISREKAPQEAYRLMVEKFAQQDSAEDVQLCLEVLWEEESSLKSVLASLSETDTFCDTWFTELTVYHQERILQLLIPEAYAQWLNLREKGHLLQFEADDYLLLETLLKQQVPYNRHLLRKMMAIGANVWLSQLLMWYQQLDVAAAKQWQQSYPELYQSIIQIAIVPSQAVGQEQASIRLTASSRPHFGRDLPDFIKVLDHSFPHVSGLVAIYLQAVFQMQGETFDLEHSDAMLYAYIQEHGAVFRTDHFLSVFNPYFAQKVGRTLVEFQEQLRQIVQLHIEQGHAAFDGWKDLLWAPNPVVSTPIEHVAPLVTLAATEALVETYKKVNLSEFKQILSDYIHHGVLATPQDPIALRVDFKQYLSKVFREYQGQLFPVLKEVLPTAFEVELLLYKKEGLQELILKELASSRHEEFHTWMIRLQTWSEATVPLPSDISLDFVAYASLLNLLLQTRSAAIGPFAFLEHVFERLHRQGTVSWRTSLIPVADTSDLGRAWNKLVEKSAFEQSIAQREDLIPHKVDQATYKSPLQDTVNVSELLTTSSIQDWKQYITTHAGQPLLLRKHFAAVVHSPQFWGQLLQKLSLVDLAHLYQGLFPGQSLALDALLQELRSLARTFQLPEQQWVLTSPSYVMLLEAQMADETLKPEEVTALFLRAVSARQPLLLRTLFEKWHDPANVSIQIQYPYLAALAQTSLIDFISDQHLKRKETNEVEGVDHKGFVVATSWLFKEAAHEMPTSVAILLSDWEAIQSEAELQKFSVQLLQNKALLHEQFWSDQLPRSFWIQVLQRLDPASRLQWWAVLLPITGYRHFTDLLIEVSNWLSIEGVQLQRAFVAAFLDLRTEVQRTDLVEKAFMKLFKQDLTALGQAFQMLSEGQLVLRKSEHPLLYQLLRTEGSLQSTDTAIGKLTRPQKTLPKQPMLLSKQDSEQQLEAFLFRDFSQLLAQKFPLWSNFVTHYVMSVKEMSHQHRELQNMAFADLYFYVYEYLVSHHKHFSSLLFLEEQLAYLSELHQVPTTTLRTWLLKLLSQKSSQDLGHHTILYYLLTVLQAHDQVDQDSEVLMERVELLPDATFLGLEEEFGSISIPAFIDRVATTHPHTVGFVATYLLALDTAMASEPRFQNTVFKAALYTVVYEVLEVQAVAFSANHFVEKVTASVASLLHSDLFWVYERLLQVSKEKVAIDMPRYAVLEQLLEQPAYQKPDPTVMPQDLSLGQVDGLAFTKDAFLTLVQASHPHTAGFVVTYLTALEEALMSLGGTQAFTFPKEIYLLVYKYLKESDAEFSSSGLLDKITTSAALWYGWPVVDLYTKLLEFSTQKILQGEARYTVLEQLLISQSTASAQVSLSEGAWHEVNYGDLQNTLVADLQQLEFIKFRNALSGYMKQGHMPLEAAATYSTVAAFEAYLQAFFQTQAGKLGPLLKEVLSLKVLEIWLERKQTWLGILLLKELSQGRYEELRQWSSELQAFVHHIHPEESAETVTLVSQKLLFLLVLHKEKVALGLFSFLELSVEALASHGLPVFVPGFQNLLGSYRLQHQGSALFLKALERIEALEAQRRQKEQLLQLMKKQSDPKRPTPKLEGRLLIHNAGMIIIAPFLYRYFDRLEMLEASKFKSEAVAQRGVQLLQYLVTGLPEMQEHELVLNKILCGVPLDTAIADSIVLTEQEIEVSESLLKGLLSNWDKLKSSSIASLREGFLIREGYLEQTETTWNLEVHRKAMDLLVDMIPWSYSLIKLSWMHTSLATKWGRSLGE